MLMADVLEFVLSRRKTDLNASDLNWKKVFISWGLGISKDDSPVC